MVNPDKLPKREFGFVKQPDAPWCTCAISHMCQKMRETLFPTVSEAGWKTIPKCKEGTEGHRALTRMGSYKRCSQSRVLFCEAGLPLCAVWDTECFTWGLGTS